MPWRALVATRRDDQVALSVEDLGDDALPGGDVTVEVQWSSVNYKDAMVSQPGNRVARVSPLVPGVDLAGVVSESADAAVPPGTQVVVHGYGLGVDHHGGFASRARVPARWVVPLPDGLTTRRAAAIGTAGFTAVLSLHKLRAAGVTPDAGPVLVTGASGGVGSMAVAAFARHGYRVVASTGKAEQRDYLLGLGAAEVVGRDVLEETAGRVLGRERWAGAVDCVGGATLAGVLRSLRYGGAVAASGLVAGVQLSTTVYPFIVRGVTLVGVDSVATPIDVRRRVWRGMGEEIDARAVDAIVEREVGLDDLAGVLDDVLASRVRGRVLLRPAATR